MSLGFYLKSQCHIHGHLGIFCYVMMLCYRLFILLYFTVITIIYFELAFVKNVQSVSRFDFIFLHVEIQLFQHHFI